MGNLVLNTYKQVIVQETFNFKQKAEKEKPVWLKKFLFITPQIIKHFILVKLDCNKWSCYISFKPVYM